MFANQPQLFGVYRDAIGIIGRSNASQIGLILGEDSWEYPIWALLRDAAPFRLFRIELVDLPEPSLYPLGPFKPDALFWNKGVKVRPQRS